MPALNGDLRFVDSASGKAFRTPRIPGQRWNQYQAEVTEVYLRSKSLSFVRKHMLQRHGFDANERQYEYRLHKAWGVKRPDMNTPDALPAPQQDGHGSQAADSPPDVAKSLYPAPLFAGKRRRHTGTQSLSSTDSTSLLPPKKKPEPDFGQPSRTNQQHLSKGSPCSGYNFADSAAGVLTLTQRGAWSVASPNALVVDTPQTLVGVASPFADSPDLRRGSMGVRSVQDFDSPSTLVDEPHDRLDSGVGLSPPRKACSQGAAEEAREDPEQIQARRTGFTWSPRFPRASVFSMLGVDEQLPSDGRFDADSESGVRVIQHNRPADTFSSRDVVDVQLSADLFSVVDCDREAFELFTTLLKRHVSDPSYRGAGFWYLAIQCAHTATQPQHLDIVQNIIQEELRRFEDTREDHEHAGGFLFHMVLALMHSKMGSQTAVLEHITEARGYIKDDDDDEWFLRMLRQLPRDDRSLDLAFYHNALRLQLGEASDLFIPLGLGSTTPPNPVFENHILTHGPGPFELEWNQSVANPCLGSCLEWCERELTSLLPLLRTSGVNATCHDNAFIGLGEENALFFTLWKRLAIEIRHPSGDTPIWISDTQARMGTSPTMLLMLVCRALQVHNADGPSIPSQKSELFRYFQRRAEHLVKVTDSELARCFLKQYILHHSITAEPPLCSNVQRPERERAMSLIRDTLCVSFHNLAASPDIPADMTSSAPFQSGELSAIQEETVATSPSNSIFLDASKRAALEVPKMKRRSGQPTATSTPPSFYLKRPGSQTSSGRDSELSSQFSSMRLSATQFVGQP
ncbi:hypothetical protein B0T14DRAFT_518424 [Immersiella caudata]|uniref:Clr5 domain-containing protein n=1 Tax=Immersiella caudata TaxID=314043 RepID=A0AA39WP69_9PEZI|nr:hypothetical protein B0T14DRAFT_518424 [Immersiella caudata]